MARPYWQTDRASLLHPTYGDSARDIRGAIGAGTSTKVDGLMAGLDMVKRVMTLNLRDFRGFYLEGRDERVTPDHNKFIGVVCPNGSVEISGSDQNPHEIQICARDPDIVGLCEDLRDQGCLCSRGISVAKADGSLFCSFDDSCTNQLHIRGGRCTSVECAGIGGGTDGVEFTVSNEMTIESCGLCVNFDAEQCTYRLDLDITIDNETPDGAAPGNQPDQNGLRWARVCTCNGVRYWFRALRGSGNCCENP